MTNILLFSAPFSFIENVKSQISALVPTEYREIWNLQELGNVRDFRYWIPNPGQTFTIDKNVLDQFESLEAIITPSTGTNHINLDECDSKNIHVKGLLDNFDTLSSIRASSEFTFLMLLNGLRRIDYAINEVKNFRWRQNEDLMRGNELIGKNIGIIGLGRNGSNVARWCKSFDANVSYYDPFVNNKNFEKRENLEEIFRLSDILVICCTLNKSTYHLINKDLLLQTKKKVLIVNSSRGELINENDLAETLNERKDIRVSLDVLSNEVTANQFSSPLIKFITEGRIIVTPHIAGATYESQDKAARGAFELLRKYVNDKLNE